MNAMTLLLLGAVISLIGGCLSLLPIRHPLAIGKHWLVCGLGCLFIGCAAVRILQTESAAAIRLWNLLPEVPVTLSVDPVSAFFLLLLSVVAVPACIYAYAYYYPTKRGLRVHGALFPLFLVSIAGVLSADHSLTFLVMWEMMSLFSFALVIHHHEQPLVRRAGFVYLAMTHFGTLFLMTAFLLMGSWTGSFRFSDWAEGGMQLADWQKHLVFGLTLIGFGTKAGIVPLHVWLPRAHPAAPAPVSALMSAVMVKVGLYGLLRVIWDWFAGGPFEWGVILLVLGLVTALTAALYLVVNDDLKQLLAYSSVENMGILLMAIGVAVLSIQAQEPGLTLLALSAFLLHALNHAVFKGLLFLVSGSIQHGAGTVRLNGLGGLARRMPWTAGLFLAGAAALAAVPLLNGFVGEWLLFQSLIGWTMHGPLPWAWLGAAGFAGLGMVSALAAAGMVKAYGAAMLAKPRSREAAEAHESPPAMRIGMLLLAAGVLAGGLLPAAVWSGVSPAASRWMAASGFTGFTGSMPDSLPALQDRLLLPLPAGVRAGPAAKKAASASAAVAEAGSPAAATAATAASSAAAGSADGRSAAETASIEASSAAAAAGSAALTAAAESAAASAEAPVLSMPLLGGIAAVVLLLLLTVLRLMYGRSRPVRKEAWGCGHSLTERMEYPATSLSYPAAMFFRSFFRPKLQQETDREADSPRHPRRIRLNLQIMHLIEAYLYAPVIRHSIRLSRRFREIQNGRIQLYLAYILITLLVLLFVHLA